MQVFRFPEPEIWDLVSRRFEIGIEYGTHFDRKITYTASNGGITNTRGRRIEVIGKKKCEFVEIGKQMIAIAYPCPLLTGHHLAPVDDCTVRCSNTMFPCIGGSGAASTNLQNALHYGLKLYNP